MSVHDQPTCPPFGPGHLVRATDSRDDFAVMASLLARLGGDVTLSTREVETFDPGRGFMIASFAASRPDLTQRLVLLRNGNLWHAYPPGWAAPVRTQQQTTIEPAEDNADQEPAEPERRPWFVFLALVLEVAPAAVAWWMWQLPGAFAVTVFAFSILFGLLWALATVGAFLTLRGKPGDDE